eukprot:TRINITY_DN14382_c0_g1_i1.p1 TRINITY_DN14382_c0_g1~~TRINITY_DN14382_c0_g1_i1.p1  ORF type:complete len:289 (-),score=24.19 TRINITY_DN14382_c0_g1_i1:522-1388(-)
MASAGRGADVLTLTHSECGSDAAPVVCRNTLALKKPDMANIGCLPCMSVLMLPTSLLGVPQLPTEEQRFLPTLVARESVDAFVDWWRSSTVKQRVDMCTAVFHNAVDKVISGQVVSEECLSCSADETLCVVCQEHFQIGETMEKLSACGHSFHSRCIRNWLKESPHCPLCRAHSKVTRSVKGREVETLSADTLLIMSSPSVPSLPSRINLSVASSARPLEDASILEARGDADAEDISGRRRDDSEEAPQLSPAAGHCRSCGYAGLKDYFRFCPDCGGAVNEALTCQSN